ncbi:MAG: hypothetical protein E7302_11160 [Butyrivibrio sp.]|nr:hypothetical protein [Butyrivibrio sp.]
MISSQSEHIRIANLEIPIGKEKALDGKYLIIGIDKETDNQIYDGADDLIREFGVSERDELRIKLLFEETISMLKMLSADFKADIWFERQGKEFQIKAEAYAQMNAPLKKELIDISTDKSNKAIKGIMSKIGDVIENGLLHYSEVMKVSQEYGGNTAEPGLMGIYGGIDGIEPGVMWTLSDYRTSIDEGKPEDDGYSDAVDELEKSIIANIAKDVLVGVKGNKIDMTIEYELA